MLTLEKCELMGADAAADGLDESKCPFIPNTPEWESWHYGFNAAMDFDLEIFEDACDSSPRYRVVSPANLCFAPSYMIH